MFEIIPSPGTNDKDWSTIKNKIEQVKPSAKTIHIDVVDGKFAPNITFADPKPFAEYTKDFIFEVHLMVDEPIRQLKSWADAGFQRFIGQIEKMSSQEEFVAQAQLLGEVGLALDKESPVDALKVPLDDLDCLLVMMIKAGQSGQAFQEELVEKVKMLSQRTTIPIEVDGGISDETILIAAANGAKRFVATSFLFGFDDPKQQFSIIENKLKELQL